MDATTGKLTDDERTPTERSAPKGVKVGCSVVTVLGLLFLWGLSELEKGMDPYYGRDVTGPGTVDGDAWSPMKAGDEAQYDDGLAVTVSEPRPTADGRSYRFTVTYENDTDGPVQLGADSAGSTASTMDGAPLVVREGEPDDEYNDEHVGQYVDWRNFEQAGEKLAGAGELGEDESLTVPIHVSGSEKGMPITVVVEPESGRNPAYWRLVLG